MTDSSASRTSQPAFRVLYQPENRGDAQVARRLEQACGMSLSLYTDFSALLDNVAREQDGCIVVVIGAGVVEAERRAQELLRQHDHVHVVLLTDPGDERNLGQHFRHLPVAAHRVETLADDVPDLSERLLAIAANLVARERYRLQMAQASDVLAGVTPGPLNVTGHAIGRQLLEKLPLGLVIADPDGFVVESNQLVRTLLSFPVRAASGPVAQQPAHLTEIVPHWVGKAVADLPPEEVITVNQEGSTRHLQLRLSLLEEEAGFILLIEDATRQEEARRVLAAATEELEHRLEHDRGALDAVTRQRDAIKHFIAALAHDLRNPIAAATMSSQLLQRQLSRGAEGSGYTLRRVQHNLERLSSMVEDLLDLTRHDTGGHLTLNRQSLRLDELVRETVEDSVMLFRKPITTVEPLPEVQGCWDRNGLQRILENLISNALKYGNPDRPPEVWLDSRAEVVALNVRNYGKTIPLDVQKIIFEPFYRAERTDSHSVPGWGVGLALVRVMAEAHGGSVAVTSGEQGGTVFTVWLPCEQAKVES